MNKFTDIIPRGIIVSCQAKERSPLRNANMLAALAYAAELGGAVAIRADTPNNIKIMRQHISIPIIGIYKKKYENGKVIITPDFESAKMVISAGAKIIAMDMTFTDCPIREESLHLLQKIHNELGVPVMADISNLDEAKHAFELGADAISTTLSGYTDQSKMDDLYKPDLELIKNIYEFTQDKIPLVAEGRFFTRDDVCSAISLGAYCVVMGKSITNSQAITEYYVNGFNSFLAKVGD